jgi:hypothetical protein
MRAIYRLAINIARAVNRLGMPRKKLSTKFGQIVSIVSLLDELQ